MNVIPKYSNVGQLFNTDSFFNIPKYQRPYSWEDEHIDDFISDINSCYSSNEKTHFLGGIVTIEKKIEGTNKTEYEVIDGQQRLTTISLFAFALLKYHIKLKEELTTVICDYDSTPLYESLDVSIRELQDQYVRLRFNNNGEVQTKFKLDPSNADAKFYTSFISEIDIIETNNSHFKITNAFNKLSNFIDTITEFNKYLPLELSLDILNMKYKNLNSIVNILNENLYILNIITQKKSDAYKLFQTLNNRGLNLTVADLLKASTLELLDSYPTHQNLAEDLWIDMVDSEHIVDFLKSYYFSEVGVYPNKNNLYDLLLCQLFPKTISNESDAKKLCNKLIDLSKSLKQYSSIISGEWPYQTHNSSLSLWNKNRLHILIKNLKHTQCISVLLHASKLKEEDFYKFVHLIERFFFRTKIIYGVHAASLTKVYGDICKNFFSKPDYNFNDFKAYIIDYSNDKTPDDKFDENIEVNLYYKKTGGNVDLKYLFTLIDDYYDYCLKSLNNPKQFIKLSNDCYKTYDFELISIEHVCAQNGSEIFDKKSINKLGNLTLLSQKKNTLLKDKKYEEKRTELSDPAIKMNSYFKPIDNWTSIEFKNRNSYIIKQSKILFDLNR